MLDMDWRLAIPFLVWGAIGFILFCLILIQVGRIL